MTEEKLNNLKDGPYLINGYLYNKDNKSFYLADNDEDPSYASDLSGRLSVTVVELSEKNKDNPVPSLDKNDIETINKALISYNYEGEDRFMLISKLENLLQNGVETDSVEPIDERCEWCKAHNEKECACDS